MHYLCIIKSNSRSAPDSIMQRIQLTADKTQLTSTHDLQCLWQKLITRAMMMPYYFRNRSETLLMNITLIWEGLSRDTTQFASTYCLCNSLHEVNNRHGQYIYTEIKVANISFIHFIIALRQGDAVNHHLLHRCHKRWIWLIVFSYWLPDISQKTLMDLALDGKSSKGGKHNTWPWLPASKSSRYVPRV